MDCKWTNENKTQAIVGHVITETLKVLILISMAILEQELKKS